MSPQERRQAFRAFGQILVQVGTRAAAHATKSVFKDGARAVKIVERKVNSAIDKLEEMTSVDPDDGDDEADR